jgi:predicted kinase
MLMAGLSLSDKTGLAAYLIVREVAADQLRLGRTVIVDAVNGVEEAREMWRTLAAECGVAPFVVEVLCSNLQEHRRRVESRGAPTPPLPRPTWSEVVQREYQPWTEPILTIDSVTTVDESIARILTYLSG